MQNQRILSLTRYSEALRKPIEFPRRQKKGEYWGPDDPFRRVPRKNQVKESEKYGR
jgi:hypothetical protein